MATELCELAGRSGYAGVVACANPAEYRGVAGCEHEHIFTRLICASHFARIQAAEPQWCYTCHLAGHPDVRARLQRLEAL